jgi:thiol-disulfide isomerase/thioredoxin
MTDSRRLGIIRSSLFTLKETTLTAIKWLLFWVSILFVGSGHTVERVDIFKLGQPMNSPSAYEYLDGSPIDLDAFKGKTLIIYYGADWCAPCFVARPAVLSMGKKYSDQGLQVIILFADPEKKREANIDFAAKNGVLVGMSKKERCVSSLSKCSYGIEGGPWGTPKGSMTLPSAFVVDKQGNLRAYLSGADSVRFDIEREINKAAVTP